MGKKRMPTAEGFARMEKRRKDEIESNAKAAFAENRRERLFGKADESTLFQQFTSGSSASGVDRNAEREKERQRLLQMEKQRQQEDEKAARKKAEAMRPRKLLICGDVKGKLEKLFSTVEAQDKKVGPFDGVLCAGSFLPESGNADGGALAFLQGAKGIPRDCFFVDKSAALLQAAPKGKTLKDNLHFLGAYGVRTVCGLRVAFLSGYYDSSVYERSDVDFVGGAFTARAVNELRKRVLKDPGQRGIDILLTCPWPADIDEKIEDLAQRPPEVENNPSWTLSSAPPLAELCQDIEPRYHIFGSANIFYQRPPFQTARRGHACRCIGLGQVGSTSKQQKWLHALQLSPMAYMQKDELQKAAPGSTACPFKSNTATNASSGQELAASEQAPAESEDCKTREQALAHLLAGEVDQYWDLDAKLRGSAFTYVPLPVPDGNAAKS